MKYLIAVCMVALFGSSVSAQKYFTRDGKVVFSSQAPMESIEGVNTKAASVMDISTGAVEFAVLIKSFHFEKALMQEHFNENYLESSKFPKATFKGTITNLDQIKFSTDGTYHAMVSGDITIHGVTKPMQVEGTVTVANGAIHASAAFDLLVADYNIEIPKIVRDNVSKSVQVQVDIDYKPLSE